MMSKYLRWYMQIIYRAQTRTDDVVGERHHIVPKTLGGGNEARNLVKLTHREHFLCHWLLVYIACEGDEKRKMNHAFSRMIGATGKNGRPKLTSWKYERARLAQADAMLGNARAYGSKGNKGKKRAPFTDEHRARISAAKLGNTCASGKRTEEQRARISAAQTAEIRAKMGAARKGKPAWNKGKKFGPLTEEHKAKLSAVMLGNQNRKKKGNSHAG